MIASAPQPKAKIDFLTGELWPPNLARLDIGSESDFPLPTPMRKRAERGRKVNLRLRMDILVVLFYSSFYHLIVMMHIIDVENWENT